MTLLCRETFYIRKYNTIENGYNIVDSIKETLTNKYDIFQRDKIQSNEMSNMIKVFLNNNYKLLRDENIILTNDSVLLKEKSKSIKPKKSKVENVSEVNIKKPKNKKDKNECFKNIGCIGMNEVYSYMKDNHIISDKMLISSFRTILSDNNIIYFDNGSWHNTQYSLDNKLILLGDLRKNKDGFTYNQLWFTTNGIKTIEDIFIKKME